MKTAILVSGNARSFGGVDIPAFKDGLENPRFKEPWARECFPNQFWYLYRHLGDVEFFVSLAEDKHAHEVEPLLLSRYPKERVHVEIVKQPTLPEPAWETTFHSAYPIASPFQNILRDLWHRHRVWQFFQERKRCLADLAHNGFTQFVRLRPDLFFQSVQLPSVGAQDLWTPWWSAWGGLNDRFAIMGWDAAPTYFKAFSKVDELLAAGCPMHPESLTCAAVEMNPNIVIRQTLNVVFGSLRRNGEMATNEIAESALSYLKAGIEAVAQTE